MAIAPSFQDLLDQFQAEVQDRRPDLVFAEGDITVAMAHGAAAVADAVIRFCAQAFKETFLDGAAGDALTALVDDHLNLQRQPANSALVTVIWSRTTSGAGGTIPAGSVVATEFDAAGQTIEFATDSPFLVTAGDNGPFFIACTAVLVGVDANVQANTITRVVDQPAFDPNFTCNNPLAAAGGAEEETDEALRTRARDFFTTLRRGTLTALEFGARSVPGVAVATAIENPTVTGEVTILVTDVSGNSNARMLADVTTELENWRCAGTIVQVVGGATLVVDADIELVVRAGFSVAARATDFIEAVEARIDKLAINETLFLDSLVAAVIAVDPDNIFDVEFTSITAGGTPQSIDNVVPLPFQLIRPGTFTFAEVP